VQGSHGDVLHPSAGAPEWGDARQWMHGIKSGLSGAQKQQIYFGV
jgi:hypothetical protein